jgi:hypothetical protein
MNTGDLVFFRRRGIIPGLIRFGTWLGATIRREAVPDWIPHHVEIALVEDGIDYLYGADAVAGFVRRPHYFRLAGLKEGKHYRVVPIAIHGHREGVRAAIKRLEGTPYEEWVNVLKVWRKGNTDRSDDRIFCSEAAVRVLQEDGVAWVLPLDPDNVSPLKLYALSLRHV